MSADHEAQIPCHKHGDVVVLRPVGPLDVTATDEIRVLTLEAHAPVVIDLGSCLRFGIDALRRLAEDWKLFRPKMSLVCPDPGDLRMLSASELSDPLPVFGTVEHAVASLCSSGRRWPALEGTTDASPASGARTPEAVS